MKSLTAYFLLAVSAACGLNGQQWTLDQRIDLLTQRGDGGPEDPPLEYQDLTTYLKRKYNITRTKQSLRAEVYRLCKGKGVASALAGLEADKAAAEAVALAERAATARSADISVAEAAALAAEQAPEISAVKAAAVAAAEPAREISVAEARGLMEKLLTEEKLPQEDRARIASAPTREGWLFDVEESRRLSLALWDRPLWEGDPLVQGLKPMIEAGWFSPVALQALSEAAPRLPDSLSSPRALERLRAAGVEEPTEKSAKEAREKARRERRRGQKK